MPIQFWNYDQGTATYIAAAFDPEVEGRLSLFPPQLQTQIMETNSYSTQR